MRFALLSVEAEFVAFGVGHHDEPGAERRFGLEAAYPGGAEGDQPLALCFECRRPVGALHTIAKYRSFLDNQLLPQWRAWPLIAIFNGYVEIERWLSQLHEDYAESSVSSYFALFSTILNGAVRARMIPANPCNGVRVSKGSTTPSGWWERRRRRCVRRCGSTSWVWGCRDSCCA